MKITQANLEFIKNDVYLNMKALVPTQNYNSWYLRKNLDVKLTKNISNKVLDFTFCCDQSPLINELAFRTKVIRQKVASNKWFNGLQVNVSGNKEIFRLHKVCLREDSIGYDDFDFEVVGVKGKTLHIKAEYLGGNRAHAFQLNWDGYVKYNNMIQIVLDITHNSNDDDGIVKKSELLQFDLSDLFLLKENLRIVVKSDKKIGITIHNP